MLRIATALSLLCTLSVSATSYEQIIIAASPNSGEQIQLYTSVIRQEMERVSDVSIRGGGRSDELIETDAGRRLFVNLVGPNDHETHTAWFRSQGISPFTEIDPGPEGFLLHLKSSAEDPPGDTVTIVGVDIRGVLYGVGELLRRMEFFEGHIELPDELELRTAPAFEARGLNVGQGHTITELTGSREWTQEEWERAVTGYALAGANTMSLGYGTSADNPHYQFTKKLGLKALVSVNPNVGQGPPEWQAKEAIGRTNYLCLSVPEARAYKLEQEEKRWANTPPVDYVRMKSGDGGGCECTKCAPYGAVFIRMCADIAAIIHMHQPDAEIFALNQKLDNAGDIAIFEYLQEEPRPWLRAIAIGPGSNAMGWMPGRRQDHRMDLFRYPAFGPMDRYFREIIHQIPPIHDLVFFTDLTHWVYAQNGLMDHALIPDRDHNLPPKADHYIYDRKPDPNLAQVYDRRAFNARPRAYYDRFREAMRYGIGDVAYSEGHHDHFNTWMWQRLMWAPDTPLDDVVAEYARAHFGANVEPLMTQAIYQFEENLQTPIEDNEGITVFYGLVNAAGSRMRPNIKKADYLWREYMQRALTDRYIQANVRDQRTRLAEVEQRCADGLEHNQMNHAISSALEIIRLPQETEAMAEWKAEALRLGKESDGIYGVQVAGMYNLEQDYVGLGWYEDELVRAQSADEETQREILLSLADYEMEILGAIYDDLGDEDNSPHVTVGWPYGDGIFDRSNRRSQQSCAFTTDEKQGVTLEYTGLDPEKQYTARMTLVQPRYLERFGKFQYQSRQSIFADEYVLADNMELPEYSAEQFEFTIPKEATADGELRIWCRKATGVGEGDPGDVTVWRNTGGWGTLLSEVWLIPSAP